MTQRNVITKRIRNLVVNNDGAQLPATATHRVLLDDEAYELLNSLSDLLEPKISELSPIFPRYPHARDTAFSHWKTSPEGLKAARTAMLAVQRSLSTNSKTSFESELRRLFYAAYPLYAPRVGRPAGYSPVAKRNARHLEIVKMALEIATPIIKHKVGAPRTPLSRVK